MAPAPTLISLLRRPLVGRVSAQADKPAEARAVAQQVAHAARRIRADAAAAERRARAQPAHGAARHLPARVFARPASCIGRLGAFERFAGLSEQLSFRNSSSATCTPVSSLGNWLRQRLAQIPSTRRRAPRVRR
eukprot:726433-Pleurochrysis_carterae.AAC.2